MALRILEFIHADHANQCQDPVLRTVLNQILNGIVDFVPGRVEPELCTESADRRQPSADTNPSQRTCASTSAASQK